MKISQGILAALVTSTGAAALPFNRFTSPLEVSLTALGNTQVKVTITNNANRTLNLLRHGTIFDENMPIEKVKVYANGSDQVPFEGIKPTILTTDLSHDDFVTLTPGTTKEVTVETAAFHTLANSGDYDILAQGRLPFAEANSTVLSDTLTYRSNKLTLSVDGALAATVPKALQKRTAISKGCPSKELSDLLAALKDCHVLAKSAATAALLGTKLRRYFKSDSRDVRKTVAARLSAVSKDCGSQAATTSSDCSDAYIGCFYLVVAYTVPNMKYINYCPTFFRMPPLTSVCYGVDQATTVIHEETHAPAVFSPGTDDFAYGIMDSLSLPMRYAMQNADTYALYSNAIRLDC